MRNFILTLAFLLFALLLVAQQGLKKHSISLGSGINQGFSDKVVAIEKNAEYCYKGIWTIGLGILGYRRNDPGTPLDWDGINLKESSTNTYLKTGINLSSEVNNFAFKINFGRYFGKYRNFSFSLNPDYEEHVYEGDPFNILHILYNAIIKDEGNKYNYEPREVKAGGLLFESMVDIRILKGLRCELGLRYLQNHPVSDWNKIARLKYEFSF